MRESLSDDTLGRGLPAIDVHHSLRSHVAPSVESLTSLTPSDTEPSSPDLTIPSESEDQLEHNHDHDRLSSSLAAHSPTLPCADSFQDSAQQAASLLQEVDSTPSRAESSSTHHTIFHLESCC